MTRSQPLARPIIIAGPCMAESYQLLTDVVEPMLSLAGELNFDYYFKASFDKANRTSYNSYRGPGLAQACQWFGDLKSRYPAVRVLTDVHETAQIPAAAEVCDSLQIPAFLCRQTDLVAAAVASGCFVNIKKGQFMAPAAMGHIVGKAQAVAADHNLPLRLSLTERGSSFGYGDLVVDMRSLAVMAATEVPVIFDITHSTQQPAAGGHAGGVSGALRQHAPLLARAATATGYLGGFFLEVHPVPAKAKSDAAAQLTVAQAQALLRQLVPLWHSAREWQELDRSFAD